MGSGRGRPAPRTSRTGRARAAGPGTPSALDRSLGSKPFFATYQRALRHRVQVESTYQDWLSNSFSVKWQPGALMGHRYLVGYLAEEPPPELSDALWAGLNALRASLDQMAYAIATKSRGEALSDQLRRESSFPIVATYSSAADRQLARAAGNLWPGPAFEVLEKLQPRQHANPERHRLELLRVLTNLDKHQETPPVLSGQDIARRVQFGAPPNQQAYIGRAYIPDLNDRRVLPGKQVRLLALSPDSRGPIDVLSPGTAVTLRFDASSPAPNEDVTQVLDRAFGFVHDRVFAALGRYA